MGESVAMAKEEGEQNDLSRQRRWKADSAMIVFFPFSICHWMLPPEIQLFFPCNDLFASEVKRLDRASILDHYRSRGAGATFLAATCEHELPTGDIAILVYVLPKYK